MQTSEEPGLRERQRRERLALIHESAAELALEQGLTAATVDAIAARAGVSRRTFFNYYASKEDAVLGTAPLSVPAEAAAAFYTGDPHENLLPRTVNLVLAIVRSSRPGKAPRGRRLKLVQQFPELAARHKEHAREAIELVLNTVTERAASPDGELPGGMDPEKAKFLVLTAGVVIRAASDRIPNASDDEFDEALADVLITYKNFLKEL